MGAGRPVTVLVVEDERLVRLAIRHYLEKRGYRVLEAGECGEALCRMGEHDVDLVLTDITLPGRSGRELAQEITSNHPTVRVLFMSAHPRETLRRSGQVPSDSTTLQKPFTEAALVDTVRAMLA